MDKVEAISYTVKDSNGIQQKVISYSADEFINLDDVISKLETLKTDINTYLGKIYENLNNIYNAFSIGGKDITTLAQEVAENVNNTKSIVEVNIEKEKEEITGIYNEIQKNLNQQAQEQAKQYNGS